MTPPVQYTSRDTCITPTGRNSKCGQIAMRLIDTKAELARVARLANRSPKSFAAFADELSVAKANRARALAQRDEHMSECPGAAERFAS